MSLFWEIDFSTVIITSDIPQCVGSIDFHIVGLVVHSVEL